MFRCLKTNGYQLYYWESDNTAEVDFLIQKENHVIPVECKAGNHVKAKSMMVYMEKYAPHTQSEFQQEISVWCRE